MKPDQQRIAIAGACGWTHIIELKLPIYESWCVGMPARHEQVLVGKPPRDLLPNERAFNGAIEVKKGRKITQVPLKRTYIPDYLTDLNAMHEAEKGLTTEQRHDMVRHLGWMLEADVMAREFVTTFATAAQRAEAFLRTLNLWTDE